MDDSVVKVLRHGSVRPVGAGVLLGRRRIATCAHVVNLARSKSPDAQDPPGPNETILIEFGARPGARVGARLTDLADWSPPPRRGLDGRDLCILHLENDPPAGARVARTAIDLESIGSEFRAIGYPPGWPNGDSADGKIVLKANGLYYLRPKEPLQAMVGVFLSALMLRRPAGLIHGGFSGGPVEVDGKVVGLVTRGRRRFVDVTAFMVALSVREQQPRAETALTTLRTLRPRPWTQISGAGTHASTRDVVDAWITREDAGPLVLLDHFDADLDSTYAEILDTQHFKAWGAENLSIERSDFRESVLPYTIVRLESRIDFDYEQEALANQIKGLARQLRACKGRVIILSSRSILRSDTIATLLRGIPYAFNAGQLYDRIEARAHSIRVHGSALALHVSANSPTLSHAASTIEQTINGQAGCLRQLANRAMAADQLEPAVRADIALLTLRLNARQRHGTLGVAYPPPQSNGPAEIYSDVGEIDSLLSCADLIGPIGSGKTTALRSMERQLVFAPSSNAASAHAMPVWLPLYVLVDGRVEGDKASTPTLLEYLRKHIPSQVLVGSGDEHELAGLRFLLSNAKSLADLGRLISSPILFLMDVVGRYGFRLAKHFVTQIRSDLPSAGYIVAHEDANAPLTDHVIHLARPNLTAVKTVLGCSDDDVFEALRESEDAPHVLTNWSLLRMLGEIRQDGSSSSADSKSLIERYLGNLLNTPALEGEDDRNAFLTWLIERSPGGPANRFEAIAERLHLSSAGSGGTGWINVLLQALRWQRMEESARKTAVRRWLQGEEQSIEAPAFLLRLVNPAEAARLLQDIMRADAVQSLRLLNRLPRQLAREVDQLGQISEFTLASALTGAAATSAVARSSIMRGLSRHDPRVSLPPRLVSYKLRDGTPAMIGELPVTRSQFEAFVRDRGYERREFWPNESVFRSVCGTELAANRLWDLTTRGLGNAPVTDISLIEAAAFCAWLSQEYAQKYFLPTESQWDAAAGIAEGVLTMAATGPLAVTRSRVSGTGVDFRAEHSWQPKADVPVGLGSPNPIGCHDLFGLIWEWCDSWAQAPHPETPPSKAAGDVRASVVIRGCPRPVAANLFELLGGQLAPTSSMSNLGFRVFLHSPDLPR